MGDFLPGGGGFTFDLGNIFSGIINFIIDVVNTIIRAFNALVNALVKAFDNVAAAHNALLGFTVGAHVSVWKILHSIVGEIFHGHVLLLLKHLYDLFDRLRKWAAKLKAWLDRLRRIQQLHQMAALRRFLNMIQRVRQVLVLFRILHVGWATRLDKWLAGIEGRVITRELAIARKTNELIGFMNLLVDPLGLLRILPFWGTVARDLGAVLGAVRAVGLDKVFPQLRIAAGPHTPTVPWAHYWRTPAAIAPGGAGAYGEFQRSVVGVRAILNRDLDT